LDSLTPAEDPVIWDKIDGKSKGSTAFRQKIIQGNSRKYSF
jgi:hypothetical protein